MIRYMLSATFLPYSTQAASAVLSGLQSVFSPSPITAKPAVFRPSLITFTDSPLQPYAPKAKPFFSLNLSPRISSRRAAMELKAPWLIVGDPMPTAFDLKTSVMMSFLSVFEAL